MAAARYWRIVGVVPVGQGALELSAVQLYAGGVRVGAAASLSCSHDPISGALINWADGDAATLCAFSRDALRSSGFHVTFDMGVETIVDGLRLGSGSGQSTFMAAADLMFSSDQTNWQQFGRLGTFVYPGAFSLQPEPAAAGDPKFAQVVALLPCDGAVGVATTATDLSSAGRTITVSGGVEYSTTGALAGTAFSFPGTGGALVDIPRDTDLVFGTGDFAIEGVYTYDPSVIASSAVPWHFGSYNVAGDVGYALFMTKSGGNVKVGIVGLASYDVFDVCFVTVAADSINKLAIKAQRRSGVAELFLGGVLVASAASALNINVQQNFRLGGLNNPGSTTSYGTIYAFKGQVDEFRVTAAHRGIGSYTPDVAPFPSSASGGGTLFDPPIFSASTLRSSVAASSLVGTAASRSVSPLRLARDNEFGGQGRIYGTTKTKGAPNTPTKARVVLLHQRSKLPVRETWSNPVTGYFEFAGIDTSQQFLTLAEDAAGNFRPVAASRLAPEVVV